MCLTRLARRGSRDRRVREGISACSGRVWVAAVESGAAVQEIIVVTDPDYFSLLLECVVHNCDSAHLTCYFKSRLRASDTLDIFSFHEARSSFATSNKVP